MLVRKQAVCQVVMVRNGNPVGMMGADAIVVPCHVEQGMTMQGACQVDEIGELSLRNSYLSSER